MVVTGPSPAAEPVVKPKSQNGPLVSVVVATFNEGDFLTHALTSIQAQNHARFQCIVVDDASEDGSVQRAIADLKGDDRFQVVRNQANRGLAASRNVGLAEAEGQMVTFVDGDDFLFPDSLGHRIATFESAVDNGTLGGAFCNWVLVPENEVPGADPPHAPIRRNVTWLSAVEDNPFIASSPLILTETARAVGGFNESLVTAEDFDFWARYLRHGYALRASQYVGIAYRQKQRSMYRSTIQDHVETQLLVYGFNFQQLSNPTSTANGPFLFDQPPAVYQQQLMRARRICVGITVATHDRNTDGAERLLAAFSESVSPWMLWAEDWTAIIHKTATRLEAYSSVASDVRTADLRVRVESRVMPILFAARPETPVR